MIYTFYKRKSFSPYGIRIDPLLNYAVDLHTQAVDHRRNSTTIAGFRQARFQHWSEFGQCRNLKISTEIR